MLAGPQVMAQAAEKYEFAGTFDAPKAAFNRNSPVSEELGHHRVLRVSPLTAVPEICCDDC
jgi:hypothetical protein